MSSFSEERFVADGDSKEEDQGRRAKKTDETLAFQLEPHEVWLQNSKHVTAQLRALAVIGAVRDTCEHVAFSRTKKKLTLQYMHFRFLSRRAVDKDITESRRKLQ